LTLSVSKSVQVLTGMPAILLTAQKKKVGEVTVRNASKKPFRRRI